MTEDENVCGKFPSCLLCLVEPELNSFQKDVMIYGIRYLADLITKSAAKQVLTSRLQREQRCAARRLQTGKCGDRSESHESGSPTSGRKFKKCFSKLQIMLLTSDLLYRECFIFNFYFYHNWDIIHRSEWICVSWYQAQPGPSGVQAHKADAGWRPRHGQEARPQTGWMTPDPVGSDWTPCGHLGVCFSAAKRPWAFDLKQEQQSDRAGGASRKCWHVINPACICTLTRTGRACSSLSLSLCCCCWRFFYF